jgi:hypothetical protein
MSTAYIDPATQLITHTVNSIPYKFLGNQTNEIIISKGTQGHYSSIYTAVNANNNSNTIYAVYPGTYMESNPITLPAGSFLKGMGTAQNTVIISLNPNQPIIILGAGACVMDMTLYGANQVGGKGLYLDCTQSGGQGQFSAIIRVFVIDCNIGIEADNKNAVTPSDVIFITECVFRTQTASMDKGIYAHNGGSITMTESQLIAVPPIPNIAPNGVPIAYGIYVSDPNSKISLATINTFYLNIGIYIDNGGYAEIVLLILNSPGIGLVVGPNATNTQLVGDNFYIRNSVTYDLQVLATDAQIQFMADTLDHNKINNPNNVNLNLRYNGIKFGKAFQGTIGDIQFGTAKNPTTVSFGQGEFVTDGTIVLSNTSLETGTWTDNTTIANSTGPPYFNFYSGTTTDNCLYVGSDYPILGFETRIITATNSIVASTDVALEYWNGTSWIQFNIMKTFDGPPYYTYPNCFISVSDTFDVRFGLNSETSFALKTLNNYNKYWIRSRIINAISNTPTCDYLKLHPSTKIINDDGWTEYFGDSRSIKDLAITGFMMSNSTIGDQQIFVSTNLSIAKTKNLLTNGNLCRLGTNSILPKNIDNSFPIKFELSFVVNSSSSGNIYFTVRFATTVSTNSLFVNSGDAPNTPPGNMSTTLTIPISVNSNNQDLRQKFYINVNYIDPNPADGSANLFWMSLERDATIGNGNDTFPGDVAIVTIKSEYISWNDGGHILSY